MVNDFSFVIDINAKTFPDTWDVETIVYHFCDGQGLGEIRQVFPLGEEVLKRIKEYNISHPNRNKTPEIKLKDKEVFIGYKYLGNSLYFVFQVQNEGRLFFVEVNKKYKPVTGKGFHDWLMGR